MHIKKVHRGYLLRTTTMVLNTLVISAGLMVLSGWVFDVAILKSLHIDFVSMKANTAISFVLLAIACLLMVLQKERPEQTKWTIQVGEQISKAFVFFVLAISTLTIIQYVFAVNIGIDEMFFKDDPVAVATYAPGRMALNTAIGLMILSFVLVLYSIKAEILSFAAQLLSLLVLLLSILPIFGYLYRIDSLFSYGIYTQMALHSGILFLLLSCSFLLLQIDKGLLAIFSSPGTGGYFARRLLPAAVIAPIFLVWLRIVFENYEIPFLPADLSYFFIIMIIIFVWFVWRIAVSLNKLDKQREQAEETSQNWTNLMQYIIKYDPNAIAVLDKNLHFIYVSDRFLSDYKLQNKDIVGKHHYEVFPDIPEKWKIVHQRALQGEVLRSEEDVFERADGSTEYTSWECRPWHNHDGTINGIIIYTEVLTAIKTTEKQLRKISNQLKLILENAGDGIFAVDREGRAILLNKKALEMLGYEESELIGEKIHPLHQHSRIDGSRYPIEECAIYKTYTDGEVHTVNDEVFMHKDGSSFPVEYVSTPILDNDSIAGAVVSFRDISERKKVEQDIHNKNVFIQTVLDNLPIGVALNTLNRGEATYMNNKFEEIYGWDKDTINNIQLFFKKVYPDPSYRKELTDRIMADIQSGDPARMQWKDIKVTTSDGSVKTVNALNIPLIEQNTMVSTVIDITKQKLVEKELEMLNDQLEHKIKQRTQQLEATNMELEAFTYSVSHDLRAPLRAIDGFTRILQEDHKATLSDEGKRISQVIRENTQSMGQLIDDLLTFSRLSRKEMQQSEIDMKTLVNAIYHELTSEQDRERTTLIIQNIPKALGDPTMIRQVWMNLLSNALKFSAKKEEPIITISSSSANGFTTYIVCDNGVGFDMRYVDKIFGVFQRLHSAREFEGTGVGLAIVQRLISKHGGTVTAESNIDEYAAISFSLPQKSF